MIQSLIHRSGLSLLLVCGVGYGRLWAGDLVLSNAPSSLSTLDSTPAPALGQLPTPGTVSTSVPTEADRLKKYKLQLDLSREQRRQKSTSLAEQTLTGLITADTPVEIRRLALFELALVAQDEDKLVRAEQIFGQYLQIYSEDPSAPEVLLRQGLIYRQMGVDPLAISKFYAVMSTALKLKLENMDYYKNLVLQAQIEIADTYYQEGNYEDAADFFGRRIKSANAALNQAQTHFKLVRSLSYTTNSMGTIAEAQNFLTLFTNVPEVPEVRFFLASSLKKLGRNNDSMKQVLLLLQSQEENVRKNLEVWTYWQQRAGNEIANQLFKEGDSLDALQIYLSLADLDKSPAWQLPAWYQAGLIYEQLQQWQKATAMYLRIIDRQKELTDATATPSLLSLLEMAKWRKDYIDWMQKAKIAQQTFVLNRGTNASPAALP